MSFSAQIKEHALVACARDCCICHCFAGLKIELHHIKQKSEGGADTFENCIPLCLGCHADMRSYDHRHPKGTKYSPAELLAHRDNWYGQAHNVPIAEYTVASADLDRAVLQEIKTILPWNGSVKFVRTHNFAGFPYRRERLDQLWEFSERYDDAAFEFLDTELEACRAELLSQIDVLDTLLAENVHSHDTRVDLSWIPADWEATFPDRFRQAVNGVHQAGRAIGSTYDDLVRAGRRKLGN